MNGSQTVFLTDAQTEFNYLFNYSTERTKGDQALLNLILEMTSRIANLVELAYQNNIKFAPCDARKPLLTAQ